MTCPNCKTNIVGVRCSDKSYDFYANKPDTEVVHHTCNSCGKKHEVFMFEIRELLEVV
jgi:RNase P subunit RPR2